MEKEEVKSKWDELARQIGAEISPETEQIVENAATSLQPSESYAPAGSVPKVHERLPAKRPAGWDNLASEFGLPIPEPVEQPVVEETHLAVTKHHAVSQVTEGEAPSRERQRERPSHERRPPQQRSRERHERDRDDSERPPARGRSRARRSHDEAGEAREGAPRRGRRDRPERRRESRPRVVEPQYADEVEPAERSGSESTTIPAAREPDRDVAKEEPKPAPAVSLWQKIFGTPAEPQKPIEPVSPSSEFDESGGVESSTQSEMVRAREDDIHHAKRFDVVEDDDRSSAELDDETEAAAGEEQTELRERRRPRRRRRGRGGRGEQRGESRSTAAAGDDFDAEDDAVDAETAESLGSEEDADATSVNGRGSGERSGGERRSALQRSIPSWDEAIGHIVDFNMQARSQRRPSSPSGSPRGRTRGRRKR